MIDEEGRELGRHQGQHRFTIGQRRGLSLSLGHPVYVVGRDAATNTVTVGGRERLTSAGCIASEANWIEPGWPRLEWRPCLAKYRYNSDAISAEARLLGDSTETTPSGRPGRFEVRFAEPQQAVAPGQAVVLYSADEPDLLLGGGWIERTTPA